LFLLYKSFIPYELFPFMVKVYYVSCLVRNANNCENRFSEPNSLKKFIVFLQMNILKVTSQVILLLLFTGEFLSQDNRFNDGERSSTWTSHWIKQGM